MTNAQEHVVDRKLTELDAYHVARMMCEKGLSANRIAAELYREEYAAPRTKARAIMRVKHLLRRALDAGILTLRRPRTDLATALRERPGLTEIRFEVVDDSGFGLDPAEPVYREAARLVAERIDALMRRQERVVIANAGGWGMSRLVEYLAAVSMTYENAGQRLQFVSLNALSSADRYHLSANFVAVRMATIFGGRHLAMVKSPSVERAYRQALQNIDLLVCGAGSRSAFLTQWLNDGPARKAAGKNIDLPKSVVGDICLIPLNAAGEQVSLGRPTAMRIQDDLRPCPDHATLKRLAEADRVLLVAAAPNVDGRVTPPDDLRASSKLPVVKAILNVPLTRWCVLGSSLAEQLRTALESDD